MAKSNDILIIFNDEQRDIQVLPVVDVGDEDIEVKDGIYRLADCTSYVDTVKSRVVYMINVDIPTRTEASNLKLLRRSTALKNIMKFERGSKMDIMKLMPYIIIFLLILFK